MVKSKALIEDEECAKCFLSWNHSCFYSKKKSGNEWTVNLICEHHLTNDEGKLSTIFIDIEDNKLGLMVPIFPHA